MFIDFEDRGRYPCVENTSEDFTFSQTETVERVPSPPGHGQVII